MPFSIRVEPTNIATEIAEYDIFVANERVSRIASLRSIEELRLDYSLPAVWLRYMDPSQTRDTDLEIISMVTCFTMGMRL